MKGVTCGPWKIEERIAIDPDGVTPSHWISDGDQEFTTEAELAQLMIAIAKLLGVESWQHVDDSGEDS